MDSASGRSVRIITIGGVCCLAVLMTGCTTAVDREPGTDADALLPGLAACGRDDDPVAAFWGSDKGVGTPGRAGGPDGGDIWTITADGRVAPITDDARSRDAWLSPDGKRIYFARSQYGNLAGAAAPGTQIWRYDVATGDENMLLSTPTEGQGESMTDAEESPDGSQLVYSAAVEAPGALSRLYIIEVDRPNEPTKLTSASVDWAIEWHTEPTFSPDGLSVAYLHTGYDGTDESAEGQSSIRVLDLATQEESILYAPRGTTVLHGLAWSSDGAILLVSDGRSAIAVDAVTGAPTVMASNTSGEVTFSSADSQSLSGVGTDWDNSGPAPEPKLTTWRDTDHSSVEFPWRDTTVTSTEFPMHLSFATGLTIARCAYADES